MHYEVIIHIPHFFYRIKFILKAFRYFTVGLFPVMPVKAFIAFPAEVLYVVTSVGGVEPRQLRFAELELNVAAFRNFNGIVGSLGQVWK